MGDILGSKPRGSREEGGALAPLRKLHVAGTVTKKLEEEHKHFAMQKREGMFEVGITFSLDLLAPGKELLLNVWFRC